MPTTVTQALHNRGLANQLNGVTVGPPNLRHILVVQVPLPGREPLRLSTQQGDAVVAATLRELLCVHQGLLALRSNLPPALQSALAADWHLVRLLCMHAVHDSVFASLASPASLLWRDRVCDSDILSYASNEYAHREDSGIVHTSRPVTRAAVDACRLNLDRIHSDADHSQISNVCAACAVPAPAPGRCARWHGHHVHRLCALLWPLP